MTELLPIPQSPDEIDAITPLQFKVYAREVTRTQSTGHRARHLPARHGRDTNEGAAGDLRLQ